MYLTTLTRAERAAVTDLTPEEIAALIYNHSLGVLSSAALRLALARATTPCDLIYFDIDFLHDLNSALGHSRADALLRPALQVRASDVIAGRTTEGDEIVVLAPVGQGVALAHRLRKALADAPLTRDEQQQLLTVTSGRVRGLSATFAVVPGAGDPVAALTVAEQAVEQRKRAGERGCITVITIAAS
jgi:GGDEF domain-containing protein